ncbi:MAG: ABC transporter permease [Ruminococcaceae bacterium]|nr:ABC transporter permease [Oscillospiraceae bacterium]
MEQNVTVRFAYFDQDLVQRVIDFTELSDDKKAKETVKAFSEEIKNIYLAKDTELKKYIQEQLVVLKQEHQKTLADLDKNLERDLAAAMANNADSKELNNVKFGLETVCKRAKIKERNTYNEQIKELKMKRVFLHEEYTKLVYNVTGVVTPIESVRNKALETKATFNLKATLTNKQFYVNLVPFCMLMLIVAAYFIGKSITGYAGDLGDVINNSVFVAVVATGAVFIYSQGGFDMSLGNASLMCATVAALTFNATGNLALSLILAVGIGAVLGILNAILATMLNLPVMVMTLTMMNIIAAVHEAILDQYGGLITVAKGMNSNAWFFAIFLAVFFAICWFIFNYTKVGRRNKFIGSNKVAARFNGINLMRAGIISFAISGVGLGICGFLFASSMSGSMYGASTVLGQVGLNVVIAIVFGGMTTSGGPKSKVSCAVIGAFFSVFLDEFFAAISTPAFQVGDYSFMVKGAIFILISLANMWDTRTKMLASGGSIQ